MTRQFVFSFVACIIVMHATAQQQQPSATVVFSGLPENTSVFVKETTTAVNAMLLRNIAGRKLVADKAGRLIYESPVSSPVTLMVRMLVDNHISEQSLLLYPGENLSVVYHQKQGEPVVLVMDTARSVVGTANKLLSCYEDRYAEIADQLKDSLYQSTSVSPRFIQEKLGEIDALEILGRMNDRDAGYLQALQHWKRVEIRCLCWYLLQHDMVLPEAYVPMFSEAYSDRSFALFSDPVFINRVMTRDIHTVFNVYSWMLEQKYDRPLGTTEDSVNIRFLFRKAYANVHDKMMKELAGYWYTNYRYLAWLRKNGSVAESENIRALAMEEIRNVTDTALRNTIVRKINETMQVLPGAGSVDFSMEDRDGKVWHLNDFKGKLVYIDVWTTWCGPCRQESPLFEKIAKEYAGKDIVFLGISADNVKAKNTWKEMAGHKETLQLYAGDNSAWLLHYQVKGFPTFLLFDRSGKIVSLDAPRPSDFTRLQAVLEGLL